MSIENKKVVITGAGGGIGQAIALSVARAGAYPILFGGNNIEKLEKTAELIAEFGECAMIPGNLTVDNEIDECIETLLSEFDGIDILINNAGVAHNASFEDTEIEFFDKIMNINCRVPFYLTQKLLPTIKKSDYATIINVSSVVAHAGYPNQSAYTASKHALLGFTKSLASEVYQDGVRVHAVSPGGVYTDMIKISRPDLTPDGMIMPQDIADIIMFLLNNRGNAVIDEIIVHRLNKPPFQV